MNCEERLQKLEWAVQYLSLAIAMSDNPALIEEMNEVMKQLGEKEFWNLGYRNGILDRMLELKLLVSNMEDVIKTIFDSHDVEFFIYNGKDFRNMEVNKGIRWTQLPFARTKLFVVVGEEKNMAKLDILLSYFDKTSIHLGHEPLDDGEVVETRKEMEEELENLYAELEEVAV